MRLHVVGLALLAACTSEQKKPAAQTAPEPTPAVVAPAPPPDAAPAAAADEEPPPGRTLTGAEIILVRPFFGESIDYAKVRVVPDRYFFMQPADVYMTPNGNIYAPGPLYQPDFAAASVSPELRALFIHEMTHVWQHQSGINLIIGGVVEFLRQSGEYGKAYPYTLAKARDLLDYGIEQQASIVEDRARIAYGLRPWRLANTSLPPAERDALYKAVLGRLFADPGYARALTPEELHARVGKASSLQSQ